MKNRGQVSTNVLRVPLQSTPEASTRPSKVFRVPVPSPRTPAPLKNRTSRLLYLFNSMTIVGDPSGSENTVDPSPLSLTIPDAIWSLTCPKDLSSAGGLID